MSNRLGIDWWDLTIHVFVTMMLAVALSEGVGMNEDFALPVVFGGSALLLAFRRKLALKRHALGDGYSTGEMAAERIADLEARVADLEQAQARVAELEERMDFSERLLTRQSHESQGVRRET
jgi:hypothetical protein